MAEILGLVGGVPLPRTVRGRLALRVVFMAVLCLLVAPPAADAQGCKRTPRLCFLTFDPGTLRTRSPRFDAFFEELEALGYVEGRNLDISCLSADNVGGRFPALIDECLSRNPM